MRIGVAILIGFLALACGDDGGGGSNFGDGATTTPGAGPSNGGDDGGSGPTSDDGAGDGGSGSSTSGFKFDVGTGTGSGGGDNPTMGCEKVDILFVIDDSGSMLDNQDKLTTAFPGMAQTIDDTLVAVQGIDYRIGVTSSNITDETMCLLGLCGPAYFGRLQHTEARVPCADVPAGRWIEGSEGAAAVSDQFTCIASLRQAQDFNGSEQPLEAARLALIDRVEDVEAYNAGFLRNDALLVLVLVTDEDDQSVWMSPSNWPLIGGPGPITPIPMFAEMLEDLKGGHPENVTVVAISGPENAGGETDAPRIHQLLANFTPNSYWTDISGSDYSTALQEALEVIEGSCEDFIPPG